MGFGSYLTWIEKTPMGKLTDSGVKEWALHEGMPLDANRGAMSLAWLDRNLWEVMQGNMTGGAVKRIKGVIKKDWRGAVSWRTILDDAIGMSGQRYTGIVNRLFEPKRFRADALEHEYEAWTALMEEYESVQGTVQRTIKEHAVQKFFPTSLAGDVERMSSQFSSFEEVDRYIRKRIQTQRNPYFEGGGAKDTSKADTDKALQHLKAAYESGQLGQQEEAEPNACDHRHGNEEDGFQTVLGALKGQWLGKGGGGGGKGGKGYQGTCWTCGRAGHKKWECQQKGKGGGKAGGKDGGGYGYGGGKGGPYGEGYGGGQKGPGKGGGYQGQGGGNYGGGYQKGGYGKSNFWPKGGFQNFPAGAYQLIGGELGQPWDAQGQQGQEEWDTGGWEPVGPQFAASLLPKCGQVISGGSGRGRDHASHLKMAVAPKPDEGSAVPALRWNLRNRFQSLEQEEEATTPAQHQQQQQQEQQQQQHETKMRRNGGHMTTNMTEMRKNRGHTTTDEEQWRAEEKKRRKKTKWHPLCVFVARSQGG